jgi:hypothetical protein
MATKRTTVLTRRRKRLRVKATSSAHTPASAPIAPPAPAPSTDAVDDLDKWLIDRLEASREFRISDLRAKWELLTADVEAGRTVLKVDIADLLYDTAMCAAFNPGRFSPSPSHYMALAKIVEGAVKLSDKDSISRKRMEACALWSKLSLYDQEAKKTGGIKNAGGRIVVRKVAIERLAREAGVEPAAMEQRVTRALKLLRPAFPRQLAQRPRRKPLRLKARHD